ncbi:MAG: DUF6765 family protein [Bacillota bacterium]
MKKDAHYYALLAMARSVGIEKETAHKIAYASQFVDDAKINKITLADDNPDSLLSVLDNSEKIINAATCHDYFIVNTFNYGAMINNTTAFHFVPGCDGNSFVKKMRCKEESPIIMEILEAALEEGDPIKLGITLHAYADTFSHQGFSGILSKVNDVNEIATSNKIDEDIGFKGFANNLFDQVKYRTKDLYLPAYGHGQVFTYPDTPYLDWKYCFDASNDFSKDFKTTIISNKERFTDAFKQIKKHLEKFIETNPKYKDDAVTEASESKFLSTLTLREIKENRIQKWKEFMVDEELFEENDQLLDYDENLWLKEAFKQFIQEDFDDRIVKEVYLKDDFMNSNWYQYYKGTQWYKKLFFQSAAKNGLLIPNEYVDMAEIIREE